MSNANEEIKRQSSSTELFIKMLRFRSLLFPLILASSLFQVYDARSFSLQTSDKDFERLPKNVVPTHYAITIEPDLTQFVFRGRQVVNVEIKEDTDKIVLNSLSLNISQASFSYNSERVIPVKSIEYNEGDEKLTLVFPSFLKKGSSGYLNISFSGVLADNLQGFYRSKYTSVEGQPDRYAAVTQFEPTYARRAFPSWDEPAIKATFEMTLVVPANEIALSNMPVVSEEMAPNGKKTVRFDVTPKMSTYLVAFIVGQFDFVEKMTSDGKIKVRVYTPVGKKDQGEFGLDVAARALMFYTEYFNVSYPLPKMDLIALADFGAGAMENWGLVTYRETLLLYDPKQTSTASKQLIAEVVSHELGHQWFGNLVTMEWWTHLWLNEGFASFMQNYCVDVLFPEFGMSQQFVADTSSQVLSLDALNNTHPVEIPVKSPGEIDEIFDAISYKKGASLLRMLYSTFGREVMRKGLSFYLNQFKYSNAETQDLWEALQKVTETRRSIREFMERFTKQKGFPLISVYEEQSESQLRTLHVTQQKFSANGQTPEPGNNSLWFVPLVITNTPINRTIQVWLENNQTEVQIKGINSSTWLVLNHEAVGYYRVQYSKEMLQRFLPAIQSKTMIALDRLNVQDDLFALAEAGRNSTVQFLKLLDAFKNEDNFSVWKSISSSLVRLSQLLSNTDFQDKFHAWGRRLLLPTYHRLGWEERKEETYNDKLLRFVILAQLASFNDSEVAVEARRRFEGHVNGSSPIRADLRSVVYSSVARNANEETFQTFVTLYRDASTQEERTRLTEAMASVPSTSMLQRVLEFAMSEEVRSQDTPTVICFVAINRNARELTWTFFQKNSEILKKRYGTARLMARLVKCVTENFATEAKASEIESFFEKNKFPGTERNLQQALENIRLNQQWLERDAEDIRSYLKNSA